MLKRTLDILLASLGIILLLPVWILIGIAIIADDGGPVLFRQIRAGQGKAPFDVLKFRTMRNHKVTRAGRWLRASGLDETLQLLQVLKGEMSLVGPRPLTMADIERLGWNTVQHMDRWCSKPGITGLAQLYSGRGKRLSLFMDRYYTAHQSLWLDLKILALSLPVNLLGKKRVRSWLRRRRTPVSAGWAPTQVPAAQVATIRVGIRALLPGEKMLDP